MLYTEVYNSTKVDEETAATLAAMKKAEIHVHLEGALSPELVHRLSVRNHIPLPAGSPEEWRAFCKFSDFNHFLECYRMTTECLVQPSDFTEMVKDFLANQASQNIVYSEASFSCIMHLNKLPADELIDALYEGVCSGEQVYNSRLQIIPDLSRDLVRGKPEQQEAILNFALAGRKKGICCAIGMGGKETGNPPELFRDIYTEARHEGLHVIAHAGESEGADFVRDSVEMLHVERIGHGIRVLEDPELTRKMAELQIPFEVSPQSNYCTRVISLDKPHPIRQMINAGLFCTVNSDDPSMFSTNLNNEYLTLAAQGFSLSELQHLNENAFRAAFTKLDIPKD